MRRSPVLANSTRWRKTDPDRAAPGPAHDQPAPPRPSFGLYPARGSIPPRCSPSLEHLGKQCESRGGFIRAHTGHGELRRKGGGCENGNLAFDPDYRAYRARSLRRGRLYAPVTSPEAWQANANINPWPRWQLLVTGRISARSNWPLSANRKCYLIGIATGHFDGADARGRMSEPRRSASK
jgi:hypothetical protein